MIKSEQWVQIETEARDCPVLATHVNYVKSGHQSREDALVAAVIELSRARRELIAERTRTMHAMLANETSRGVPAAMRMSGSPELDS